MDLVISKSISFLIIIIGGYLLKEIGFFKKEDSQVLSKIIVKLTLPCLLLTNVPKISIGPITFLLISLGIICNLVLAYASRLFFIKENRLNKASAMINCSGYNIGNLTMPFAMIFFPGIGLEYLCMFDIGNALMGLGGVYALASNYLKEDSKFDPKFLLMCLLKSVPFMTYMFIFISSLLNISLPQSILSFASIIGNANTFLIMLMIGIMLNLKIKANTIKKISKILIFRNITSTIMAIIIYLFLPIPKVAKQVLVLALYSSITSIAPIYSSQIGDTSEVPALANSLSIIIAIILSSIILMFFTN